MRTALRAEFSHRGNVVLGICGGIAFQGTQLAFVGIVLTRFGVLGGWGFSELTLLFGMRLTAHAVYVVPFSQLLFTDQVIYEGEFERFLVRPASPFLQLITRRFNLMALGDLGLGVVVLGLAVPAVASDWAWWAWPYLLIAIIGGGLVETAIQILLSALAFRIRSTRSLKLVVDGLINTLGPYPILIFGPVGAGLLTFVLPMAFVAYFPAAVLMGRMQELMVPEWVAIGAPLVGPALAWLAYRLFIREARAYQNVGG